MIVVTGATGKLGRLIMQTLLQKVPAAELAVAVRTLSKAADLAARGVQVRRVDYDRAETLGSAFAEGEQVLLISGNEVEKRAPQHLRVIAAASSARVGLLAYEQVQFVDQIMRQQGVDKLAAAVGQNALARLRLQCAYRLDRVLADDRGVAPRWLLEGPRNHVLLG